MMTTTTDPMNELQGTAVAAADEAARAATALAEAHRAAHEARQAAHSAVWQAWADGFDPAALAADVDRADVELRRVLATSELGRALVGVLASRLRANRHRGLTAPALAAGAVLSTGATEALQRSPAIVGDSMEFVGAALSAAAGEVARGLVDADIDEVTARAAAALDPPAGTGPVAYRVETETRLTGTTFGDRHLYFDEGRAWLRPGDPLVGGCGRLDGYTVTALFGPTYEAAVALDAAAHEETNP